MTNASPPPAQTRHGQAVRRLPGAMRFGRATFVATLLMLSASAIAHAEEHPQTWLPDELAMPKDMEVVTEREIGSSIRLFTISTAEDVDALFADWEESLRENGYEIIQGEGEVLSRSIEFSGSGITNAKIIQSPTSQEDRTLIEFDATLQ